MKLALVAVLAFVAVASAKIEIPNFGRGKLYKDIQEFLDLLPQDEIFAITLEYYSSDKEFKAMVKYLKSKDFKKLVKDVEALPEIEELMDYIHDAGIDIYAIVNSMNDWLGLPRLTPPKDFVKTHITGGIRGYVDDIMDILPMDELDELYEHKLETSKEFKKFIKQLESENFQNIVNEVYDHPKFQDLLDHADNAGIDLELIKDLLKELWGIHVPSRLHHRPNPRFFITV
ncbi:protein G12-like [Pseudomyrmex gracilis]|uniref:protein G12-like n=1 Tax=Pseudomyrmex gracilis TaxID=219809 RepID=UPI000995CC69|nr:protein G12-like [Pseudomyrmex gracilis]